MEVTDEFIEETFMRDLFRSEIYNIVFDYINEDINDKENLLQIINETNFKKVLLDDCSYNIRFNDEIECMCYFNIVSLWTLIEYIRKQNNITKYMGNISNQTMVQKCNLAWSWIAEDIITYEWDNIVECYQNR